MGAPIEGKDLWTAAGVLLGFQATALSWRISHESGLSDSNRVWLTPADYLNMAAILVTTVGLFIIPALGLDTLGSTRFLFGLSVFLFIGHLFTLAGHYELYGTGQHRSKEWFPTQERIVLGIVLSLVLVYSVVAIFQNCLS